VLSATKPEPEKLTNYTEPKRQNKPKNAALRTNTRAVARAMVFKLGLTFELRGAVRRPA